MDAGQELPLEQPPETLPDLTRVDSPEVVPEETIETRERIERREREGEPGRGNWRDRISVKKVLGLFNPWPNAEEVEDFFVRKD
jgi:hypothetical protein